MAERLGKTVKSQQNACAQHLDWMAAVFARPDDGIRTMSLRLAQLAQRLDSGVRPRLMAAETALSTRAASLLNSGRRSVERFSGMLGTQSGRVAAANPAQVLSRGFAWIEGPRGLVTSVDQVEVGDALHATLADGVVELSVANIRR